MRFRKATTVLAVISFIGTAYAQAPRTIPFQGRLTKASGATVADGPYTITIAIYPTLTGGSALWSETKSVSTVKGVFIASLGSDSAFPATLTFDVPYFVGLTLPPDAEMTPRLPLQAVPFAIGLSLPTQATASLTGNALSITNGGTGAGIQGRHTLTSGTEPGIKGTTSSTDPAATGVLGIVSSTSPGTASAAVRGTNNGTGTNGVGVYGTQAGTGYGVYGSTVNGVGVYGFAPQGVGIRGQSTSANGLEGISSSGVGVYASSGTGVAAQFVEHSGTADAVTVTHEGSGRGIYVNTGSGIGVSSTSSTGIAGQFSALSGSTSDALQANQLGSGNGISASAVGGSAVYATSSNGYGVHGIAVAMSGAAILGDNALGEAIVGRSSVGTSGAVVGRNDGAGSGVKGFSTKAGPGVHGVGGTSGGTGPGGLFEIIGSTDPANAIEAKSVGTGYAINAVATGTYADAIRASSAGGYGIHATTNRMGSCAVYAYNSAEGEAIVGMTSCDTSGAVVGRNDGNGSGVRGFTGGSGPGVLGENGGVAGNTGPAARFNTTYTGASANTLEVTSIGSGNTIFVNHTGVGSSTATLRNLAVFQTNGLNKARIDNTGKGFFNGGTQASGADFAEAFAVVGSRTSYEPGDVLVISQSVDRAMEKSAQPYSTLVAGVVSTKPGAVFTDRDADADLSDLVPLGVIGVIPTKVCVENGPIGRGDLLVTSSQPGVAMRAGANPPAGCVIGKALANFNAGGVGKIDALINVR